MARASVVPFASMHTTLEPRPLPPYCIMTTSSIVAFALARARIRYHHHSLRVRAYVHTAKEYRKGVLRKPNKWCHPKKKKRAKIKIYLTTYISSFFASTPSLAIWRSYDHEVISESCCPHSHQPHC